MRPPPGTYALAEDDPKTPEERRKVGKREILANSGREYLDICYVRWLNAATFRWHAATPIQRHMKVKGRASPFDGNLLYWAKRLKDHPLTKTTLGKLLQKQQGKCRWCELVFREEDHIEIDHITPKSEGGGEEFSNKAALHRHCHDQRHARHATECINDK